MVGIGSDRALACKGAWAGTARVLAVLVVLLCSVACETTKTLRHESFTAPRESRVLLMPIDIELSLMSAAGALEPRADWTQAARRHLTTALEEQLRASRVELVPYAAPRDDFESEELHTQLIKLHSAVGGAILTHKVSTELPSMELPSMKDRFEWSLGTEATALQRDFGADYGLFVFARDSYTSAGRAATMFVAAVALGVALPGGEQRAFVSLVDLRTGDVVWFNHLIDPTGDLRTLDPARETVGDLLKGFPE